MLRLIVVLGLGVLVGLSPTRMVQSQPHLAVQVSTLDSTVRPGAPFTLATAVLTDSPTPLAVELTLTLAPEVTVTELHHPTCTVQDLQVRCTDTTTVHSAFAVQLTLTARPETPAQTILTFQAIATTADAQATGAPVQVIVRGPPVTPTMTTIPTSPTPPPTATILPSPSPTALPAPTRAPTLVAATSTPAPTPHHTPAEPDAQPTAATAPPTIQPVLPTETPSITRPSEVALAPVPDRFENNWTWQQAPTIGINTINAATFVCPVPDGCPGGDHDWYRVQVKQGVVYLFATFDLDPGVDTTLRLHRLRADGHLEALPGLFNDDAQPAGGLLSALEWVADADSFIYLEVAPRTGGATIHRAGPETERASTDSAQRYRFAVVLPESPLGQEVREWVRTQSTPLTATSTPIVGAAVSRISPSGPVAPPGNVSADRSPNMAAPPPPPPPPDISAVQALSGAAVVITDTAAYLAPDLDAAVFGQLRARQAVTLQGASQIAPQGVLLLEITYHDWPVTTWVPAAAVRRTAPDGSSAADMTHPVTATITSTPQTPSALVLPSPTPTRQAAPPIQVRPDTAPPVPLSASPPTPAAVAITVEVLRQGAGPFGAGTTPLTQPILVQVVTPLDAVVAETQTDPTGQAVLTVDVPSDTALRVVVPVLGRTIPVDRNDPTITIVIPQEEE